jgi:predicted nucleic acid-binding protein
VHVRPVGEVEDDIAVWDLGRGEGEVLAWARRYPGFEAVLDDRAARRCADVLNVPVCGTVGVLMRAKRRGLCLQLAPLLDAVTHAGLYVSTEVRAKALRLVGE